MNYLNNLRLVLILALQITAPAVFAADFPVEEYKSPEAYSLEHEENEAKEEAAASSVKSFSRFCLPLLVDACEFAVWLAPFAMLSIAAADQENLSNTTCPAIYAPASPTINAPARIKGFQFPNFNFGSGAWAPASVWGTGSGMGYNYPPASN